MCMHLSSFPSSIAPTVDAPQLIIPGKPLQALHCPMFNIMELKIRPLDLGSGDGEEIKTERKKDSKAWDKCINWGEENEIKNVCEPNEVAILQNSLFNLLPCSFFKEDRNQYHILKSEFLSNCQNLIIFIFRSKNPSHNRQGKKKVFRRTLINIKFQESRGKLCPLYRILGLSMYRFCLQKYFIWRIEIILEFRQKNSNITAEDID